MGIVALGGLLRFYRLGAQSFWFDEVVTRRLLRLPLGWMVHHGLAQSESTPPLYYVVAWFWTRVFGDGEVGLRSLSAVCGTATIAAVYVVGVRLHSRRAGLVAAALTATSPILVWYSQEARSYALLVLWIVLTIVALLRVLRVGDARSLLGFGLLAGLALATHYFAVFPVAGEILLIAAVMGRRRALLASGPVLVAGAALLPLALRQRSDHHAAFIHELSLAGRLRFTASSFLIGPYDVTVAAVLTVGILVGGIILYARSEPRERAAAMPVAVIGASTVVLPVALAMLGSNYDFVFFRNLLPAWAPLAVALAVLLRKRLVVLAAGACAAGLAVVLVIATTPSLQRDNWRGLTGLMPSATVRAAMGSDTEAVVVYPSWEWISLENYDPAVRPLKDRRRVDEIVFIEEASRPPEWFATVKNADIRAPRGFRLSSRTKLQAFTITTFRAPQDREVTLSELAAMVPGSRNVKSLVTPGLDS